MKGKSQPFLVLLACLLLTGCAVPAGAGATTGAFDTASYLDGLFGDSGVKLFNDRTGDERICTGDAAKALRTILDAVQPGPPPQPLPTPMAGYEWGVFNTDDSRFSLFVQNGMLCLIDGDGEHWFTLADDDLKTLDAALREVVDGQ